MAGNVESVPVTVASESDGISDDAAIAVRGDGYSVAGNPK